MQPQQIVTTQFRANSNKRPQSISRKQQVQQMLANQNQHNAQVQKPSNGMAAVNQGTSSPGIRQVKHPSHTQMLNAIGHTNGPALGQGSKQQNFQQVAPRNLSVGRQGTLQPSLQGQVHTQRTPSNLKAKNGQPKFATNIGGGGTSKNANGPQAISNYQSGLQQQQQIQLINAQHTRHASNPRGKSGSRIQSLTQNNTINNQQVNGQQPQLDKQLKQYSQNLYKNTEQWLNQQMVDSQRDLNHMVINTDQSNAQQLLQEFLNGQHVNSQAASGSVTSNKSRMLSANKNSSQPGLPLSEQKQSMGNQRSTIEFQNNQAQMALGPNQQFSFPGTQLLNNTQVLNGVSQILPGQAQPSNLTQPLDIQQVIIGGGAFNTIQMGQDLGQPLQPQIVSNKSSNRNKNSGSNMRASQQRRVNTTLDNYKKGGPGRITQTTVDQANSNLYQQQANMNYQMQTIQPHNATKARAGSNVRNGANTKMQLTLTKDQINTGQRAKSNLKEAQMNPQMNNYLQEHQLKTHQQNNQNSNIRQQMNQSPLYNQLHMANRFKSKRSESVVTQRPPEISGSKNAIAANNRGRNTSLVTGAALDSVKTNHAQKGKFKSSGGGPLQYTIPYNKNQSAMAFQSQASGSGYDSQVSIHGQEGKQPVYAQEQQIEAGVGVIGYPPGFLPNQINHHQQMLFEQHGVPNDYQNVHPQMPLGAQTVLSRQKGQQMMNTHGVVNTQASNGQINSSLSKNSNGENSFDKKVSQTPKAPGPTRNIQGGTDTEFTSNSSTVDKVQYPVQTTHQHQIVRAQSRQRGNQRKINVARPDNQTQIDQKLVQVQLPQKGHQSQLQQRPQTKGKRTGSNVVAQLRDAVNQKPHLQTQNNGSVLISQKQAQNTAGNSGQRMAVKQQKHDQQQRRTDSSTRNQNAQVQEMNQHTSGGTKVKRTIKEIISKRNQMEINNNANHNQIIQIDPNMRHLLGEISGTVGSMDPGAIDQRNQLAMNTQETHVMLSEEEEEEDEESEMELRNRANQDQSSMGNHLQSNQISQSPNPRGETKRTQVFSGSSDEWTDQRIQEFQEKMEQSRLGVPVPEKPVDTAASKGKDAQNNMIHYETFESSSGDEMSRCIFESQALSFQNRDKVTSSKDKEVKRIERLKRKERKVNEKIKIKKEDERQNRKKERLKLNLNHVHPSQLDDLQDDVLNFKDSDRESVLSYFVKHGEAPLGRCDTPTRILNKSNDFLPIKYDERLEKAIEELDKKKGEEEKHRRKRTKSVQLVTPRQEMQQQKDKLQVLIEKLPIASLQHEIQQQIQNRRDSIKQSKRSRR